MQLYCVDDNSYLLLIKMYRLDNIKKKHCVNLLTQLHHQEGTENIHCTTNDMISPVCCKMSSGRCYIYMITLLYNEDIFQYNYKTTSPGCMHAYVCMLHMIKIFKTHQTQTSAITLTPSSHIHADTSPLPPLHTHTHRHKYTPPPPTHTHTNIATPPHTHTNIHRFLVDGNLENSF